MILMFLLLQFQELPIRFPAKLLPGITDRLKIYISSFGWMESFLKSAKTARSLTKPSILRFDYAFYCRYEAYFLQRFYKASCRRGSEWFCQKMGIEISLRRQILATQLGWIYGVLWLSGRNQKNHLHHQFEWKSEWKNPKIHQK